MGKNLIHVVIRRELCDRFDNEKYKSLSPENIQLEGEWEYVCGKLLGDKERMEKGIVLLFYSKKLKER